MKIVDTKTGDELSELTPLLGTAYHSPPLATRLSENAAAVRDKVAKVLEAAFHQWNGPSFAFTTLKFFLTGLQTTTLLGRMINQISSSAERYGWEMSTQTKMAISGWPVIGSSFGITTLAFIWNHINEKYFDSKYPVSRERQLSLFSGGIVCMAFDWLNTSFGPFSPAAFLTTLAIAVIVSIISVVFTTSSDTNELMLPSRWDGDKFRKYPEASRFKKIMNAIKGILTAYSALTTLFWAFKRELEGQSVEAKLFETLIMGALALITGGFFGFRLTRHPRAYNIFFMGCTYIQSFSLCYGALSGIGFHSHYEHHGHTNWDKGTKLAFTLFFSILSTLLALFEAMTTKFPFKENQEGTPLSNYISNKVTNSYGYTKITEATGTLFSKCWKKDTKESYEQEKKENNEDIEMQAVASFSLA